MSVRKVLGAAAGAALGVVLFASFGANAMTITNRDKTDYTLTVLMGQRSDTVVIPAGGTFEHPCTGGCNVSLLDGDETDANEKSRFVIEGGAIETANR